MTNPRLFGYTRRADGNFEKPVIFQMGTYLRVETLIRSPQGKLLCVERKRQLSRKPAR